jgi:actin-related protein
MFEKYNAPAFFLVKSAVLAAFANGRSTGLVLDSGAHCTSAVPVHDGFVLNHAIVRIPLAGDFVTSQCSKMLEQMKVEVIPTYMVGTKDTVKDHEAARWAKKPKLPNVARSYHDYMVKECLRDYQATCVQIADTGYDPETVANMPMVHYEFPNGYNQDFGGERFRLVEPLFDPSSLPGVDSSMGIAHTVSMSANMCDVDLKPVSWNCTF